ncbi:MAG: tetratricopeptide repeat protein [Thermomicrobiales bacterium]
MSDAAPADSGQRSLALLAPLTGRGGEFARGLPAPLTSLVGRERERAAVAAMLRDNAVRLLTLTGPGGVGKTRLALQVAADVAADFADGVWFVTLAPISDPHLVAPAIARALGVRESGDRLPLEGLKAYLRESEALLLVDNFEQVLAAAPLLTDLLAACPALKILVTSRAVLRVSGTYDFPVPPLALPDTERAGAVAQVAAAEAVQLFLARARAAKPDVALTEANAAIVAAICRRLDGLPLAIELAAARIRHVSPSALLARLEQRLSVLTGGARDQPARLHTMRGAIAWSYDLLGADEQRLFRRLAVFVGGFTLEAAEIVAEEPAVPRNRRIGERGGKRKAERDAGSTALRLPPSASVLDGIAALIDHSLLRQAEGEDGVPRFGMLETIREYALDQLKAGEEETSARDRHAAWCLALMEQAEVGLMGADQAEWLDRLETEQPNMRAALAWLIDADEPGPALQLAASLGWFWWSRGDPAEGRAWLEQALARGAGAPPAVRARLLGQLGEIIWSQGDYRQSVTLTEAALQDWREIGHQPGVAFCLLHLGRVAHDVGDYRRAQTLYEESLALHRAIGDDWNTTRCLANLGMVVMLQGDFDRAVLLQEEGLALARARGHAVMIAKILHNLAEVAHRRGAYPLALDLYRESLGKHQETRERRFIAQCLRGLVKIAATLGQDEPAIRLAGAEHTVRAAIGAPVSPEPERIAYERDLAALRAKLGNEAFGAAWAAGREMGLDETFATADALAARLIENSSLTDSGCAGATSLLSPRELDVLRLVVEGQTDREIADALFISRRTASTHVGSILNKLGASSRSAAVAAAIRRGLA